MKKQINPTSKAHLIRGAFYLLLLIAVCAIPFALAQSRSRGTTKRGVASNLAAAPVAPGAAQATKLSSVNSKAASQSNTGSGLLPYDVRGVAAWRSSNKAASVPTGGCTTYVTTTGRGQIVPGTADTGNHCDDCATLISLPFPVTVYGQTFTSANVSSNGALDLIGSESPFSHGCVVLPDPGWEMTIFPYQGDLRTDAQPGCADFPDGACGVFTSVTGTQGNRRFNIEWRAVHYADVTTSANFEVEFYEDIPTSFDIVYGATSDNGSDETSGVQASSAGPATTFSCGTSTLLDGLKVIYTCEQASPTPTATPTATGSPSCTPIVVTGSIANGDPTQTDRLFRSGIPQTCPATTTCAIFGDGQPRRFDSYTFTNTTGSTQCVHIDTTTACTGNQFIFIGAYLGSFDPNNICTNWIGDSGNSPNPEQAFDVDVDAGQTLVVVVSEVNFSGCPSYTVTITGLCGTASPTPTATGTPSPTPTCTPGGGTPGPWTQAAPVAVDHYGGFMDSDGTFAYEGGGYSFSVGDNINEFGRFDPVANTWTPLAPVPDLNNAEASGVYAPNVNQLFVFGGEEVNFATVVNTTRIYDIATDTWSTGAPMPDVRAFMASGYFNGKIYLVGGYSTGNISPAFLQTWEYDPVANTFATKTSIPAAAGFGGAGSGVINGHLYVAGGRDSNNLDLATTWDYDIAADTWTQRADLPSANNVPGSAVIGGTLWQFGGGNPFKGSVAMPFAGKRAVQIPDTTNALVIYDPVSDSWTSGPSLSQQRSFPAGAAVGSTAVAVGGYTGIDTTTSVEINVTTGGVCPSPSPTPTATATATGTPSATATATATASPSATATPTATATETPRPTPTPRARPTPAPRPSP
jgi:Kelch motif/Galactose oxidase, central domain